jgi:hypothetical protein
MIVHDVYFTLRDNSPAAEQALLDACRKYLTDHPGVLSFACGRRAKDHIRPVNDLEFDVSLHITFADKAAHDRYQAHARHVQFVAEQKPNWKQSRVFDTLVD